MAAHAKDALHSGSARTVAVVRSGLMADSMVILGSLIILPIVGVGLLSLILAH